MEDTGDVINFAKFNYDINLIYEFQYITYRTDNGVFFQKPKDINAMQFSKITDNSYKGGVKGLTSFIKL